MRVLRIGLVGIGAQMRENLLPSLLQMPDVRIVVACDNDTARAQGVHQFISGLPVVDNVPAMLDEVPLDAVVMACPPQVHRDMGLLAMKRGLSVFVEKPPRCALSELETLVAAANEANVAAGVGMNFRYAGPVRQLYEMTTHRRQRIPRPA